MTNCKLLGTQQKLSIIYFCLEVTLIDIKDIFLLNREFILYKLAAPNAFMFYRFFLLLREGVPNPDVFVDEFRKPLFLYFFFILNFVNLGDGLKLLFILYNLNFLVLLTFGEALRYLNINFLSLISILLFFLGLILCKYLLFKSW